MGGLCDYRVTPSPTWTWIWIWDCFGFGIGSKGTGLGTRAWQFLWVFGTPCIYFFSTDEMQTCSSTRKLWVKPSQFLSRVFCPSRRWQLLRRPESQIYLLSAFPPYLLITSRHLTQWAPSDWPPPQRIKSIINSDKRNRGLSGKLKFMLTVLLSRVGGL